MVSVSARGWYWRDDWCNSRHLLPERPLVGQSTSLVPSFAVFPVSGVPSVTINHSLVPHGHLDRCKTSNHGSSLGLFRSPFFFAHLSGRQIVKRGVDRGKGAGSGRRPKAIV